MNKITFKSIYALMLEKKRDLIFGQIVTLFAILISIPIPLLLPMLVDEVLLDKSSYLTSIIDNAFGVGSTLYYIIIITLAVIFLRIIYFLLSIIISKVFTKISKYVTFKIREKLLNHLKKLSINEYETIGSGAISANLITDVNTLDDFILKTSSKFIASILTLIAVSAVLIIIHPLMGIMILTIQPLIMLLSKKISKNVVHLKKEENESISNFQNNISEILELFSQIKASNKENHFFNESINKAKNIQEKSNEYSFISLAYERFSFTIFLVTFEILRASGLIMVAYSDLSIGLMFAMFGYIWFIITPIQDIISMQYSLASAKAAITRLNKILELEIEVDSNEELNNSNKIDFEIKDLNFSYNKDKQILKNISLKIKAGEKIAFIGASGSGKTTLAQCISSFYTIKNGDILYNHQSIHKLKKSTLRKKVFLVLQMPILFNNTLRFNITMGHENISDDKIYKALKIAQLDSLVHHMKNKLDTIVGKNGIRLSGGQRQRLSIARMIIADPSIVIFDESTSALDVHTETKLFSLLNEILKDKTVITIAHRLSTVKNANRIYVLNEGKIVEVGTHDELSKEEGHYFKFIQAQAL